MAGIGSLDGSSRTLPITLNKELSVTVNIATGSNGYLLLPVELGNGNRNVVNQQKASARKQNDKDPENLPSGESNDCESSKNASSVGGDGKMKGKAGMPVQDRISDETGRNADSAGGDGIETGTARVDGSIKGEINSADGNEVERIIGVEGGSEVV